MAEIHNLDIAGRQDDELLCRLIDGECSPQERSDIEERLANDEPLRARLEQFRSNDHLVRMAVSDGENTVPPAAVKAIADHETKSPSLGGIRYPIALAASLVMATAAVLVSNVWQPADLPDACAGFCLCQRIGHASLPGRGLGHHR